jgi:RimJ/RimL family protein N-acetyltransferase
MTQFKRRIYQLLRLASHSDISNIVEFQLAMASETENLALDPTIVAKGVRQVISELHVGNYYVWDENGIKGCLMTLPEWSEWRNGTVLWIHSVYIEPQSRKQGIYKKMYQSLKEKVLNDPGLRGLRLYVDKTNLTAQKVYRALGMSDEHYQLFEWMKP